MHLKIPFGECGEQELLIPEENLLGVAGPQQLPQVDSLSVLRRALRAPRGAEKIESFIASCRNLLVLVNDATRPTPTSMVLEELAPLFDPGRVSFMVATGTHRAPGEEELGRIFGRFRDEFRGRIFLHDARRAEMVKIGVSRNGTEIILNRRAVEADGLLVISSVEPHYFAGYTGGRKSFLPGVAAFSTIEQNHRQALLPQARILQLEGNPIHQDMVDAVTFLNKPVFDIEMVLDSRHRIYAATAGDIFQAFEEAVRMAQEVFCVSVPRPADIVVSVVRYPADIDFYQAHKGIENVKQALASGGIIILVAECRSGIGERAFYDLLGSAPDPRAVFEKIAAGYRLGYHKAAKLAEALLAGQIFAVTSLERALLQKIFFKTFDTVQQALQRALEIKGKDAGVLVVMDSSLCVPRVVK